MSQLAAKFVISRLAGFKPNSKHPFFSMVLPTGKSPMRMYEILVSNQHLFNPSTIISHNLDEYAGLKRQAGSAHPQSYESYMRNIFFSKLARKFNKSIVPQGSHINLKKLSDELSIHENNPAAYYLRGPQQFGAGKAVIIPKSSDSPYLRWIREAILEQYLDSIKKHGPVDLTISGIGGNGHIAFHESGFPMDLEIMLAKLDNTTIQNIIRDGNFNKDEAPQYAISLGAGFILNPEHSKEILLLASGARKAKPVADALFWEVTEAVPASGCQEFAMLRSSTWILDELAATHLIGRERILEEKGIEVIDLRQEKINKVMVTPDINV